MLVLSAALLAGCLEIVSGGVDRARARAGVPALRRVPALAAAAQASATRMCAEGAATVAADALATYGEPTTTAVHELVGVTPLDPSIADDLDRDVAATQAIWAIWQSDPTLLDARWNEIGVGGKKCDDGRLYLSLILRDVPPGLHPDRKTWLFMGQELGAVGGFPASLGTGYVHDQGYVDYVGMPAGVTIYTDIRFPLSLRQRINVGTGDLCGQCYLDNPAFDGTMMAIGLYMVGDLENVVSGARDANISQIGEFIRDVGQPVFLRIGYEFDGSWNGYDKTLYIQAFRRIVDRLRAEGTTNLVSVWQSSGFTTSRSTLLQWYPGDEWVDWVGYSYFTQSNPSGGMIQIARERRKPVMIAEATPQRNLSLGDETTHWNAWFAPFFAHIHANADVVKAVAYINTRWFDQPAWGAGWGDSRVQIRPEIKARWIAELEDPLWAPGDFANAANTYVLTPHDLTPP